MGNNVSNNNDDKAFLLQLQMRAQQKATEYSELLHERDLIDMKLERTKGYIEQLNHFLRAEGQQAVSVKTSSSQASGVGKPGNRSKTLPLRKERWIGMTINQIVNQILNAAPGLSFHPKDMANEIYEIQSDLDLKMVLPNLRSSMQRGARDGLWDNAERGKFKAKMTEKQGQLVNT